MSLPGTALTPLRVLHVEDSAEDSALIMRELRRGGFAPACERVDTQAAFIAALQRTDWDVIISDHSLPHYNGLAALADTRAVGKDIPFILVSGTIGETGAVNLMKAGAQDYVLKAALERLPLAVEREIREARGRALQRKLTEQLAISERMASAGMLAAGVAHEINNPLAVVMANLELVSGIFAAAGGLETRLKEIEGSLVDAREAAERIREIVRDVKLFSRPQVAERKSVDVKAVIESSIRMAWNEIRHRAHLVRDYGDVSFVDSNEARLGQILLNLLVNAAQSIPEGSASRNEIRITTRREQDGRGFIEVRDTGAGIPKELLTRIFDPFFTTKAVGVGTGLGLALCRRMVIDIGGELTVESEVGKGTAFRIMLPLATHEPLAAVASKILEPTARRARVLIVDDEVAIGRALQRALQRHHDVVVLTSGKEALSRVAAGQRFDVIMSDLMMPEVTGMAIHEELLRIAPDQAARMVFLTGGAFTERAREFLDAVPNARLEKPFRAADLLAMIAGVVR